MGYHKREIEKGVLSTLSKIREELEEAIDAEEQGATIMVLIELSDLYLATRQYLQKNFPGFEMVDLEKMADLTESAFKSGARK